MVPVPYKDPLGSTDGGVLLDGACVWESMGRIPYDGLYGTGTIQGCSDDGPT